MIVVVNVFVETLTFSALCGLYAVRSWTWERREGERMFARLVSYRNVKGQRADDDNLEKGQKRGEEPVSIAWFAACIHWKNNLVNIEPDVPQPLKRALIQRDPPLSKYDHRTTTTNRQLSAFIDSRET